MPTKNKKTNNQAWKTLIQGFVANMLEHVGENLSMRLHNWLTKFKRRAIGSVLVAVGITFFLNGVAVLINSMTGNFFPWLGYGIVGISTILVGYVLIKE